MARHLYCLTMSRFHNATRTSRSIPQKLIQEGKFHLLPVYYLLRTSALAREGIERSGSYHFADHIYANRATGIFLVGKLLDRLLLSLPSARSFRARYVHAKREIHSVVAQADHDEPIDILAVPCGLARECFEVADELYLTDHPSHGRIRWHGLDLDERLVAHLRQRSGENVHAMSFLSGDAFDEQAYGAGHDLIISMGFTEFLTDEETVRFFRMVSKKLKPGGRFYTTSMQPHVFSDYLMRQFAELHTHYRSEPLLRQLAEEAGFLQLRTHQDGLQTILVAS